MTTEQEAKQALNRPIPLPPNPLRRTPPRVLGPDSGQEPAATTPAGAGAPPPPAVRAPSRAPAPVAPSAGGPSPAAGGGGSAAAAGAGAAAAGAAVLAKEAATAGPRLGNAVAGRAGQHAEHAPQ